MANNVFDSIGNIPISTTPINVRAGDNAPGAQYGAARGLGSDLFGAEAIAAEDWQRSEQSANNALYRDLYYLQKSQSWQSSENQKVRDYEERMANTAYQRAIEDMKLAGINPVLALSGGGADTPSVSAPSASGRSSSGHSSSSSSRPNSALLVSSVLKILAGALTDRPDLVASGLVESVVDSSSFNSRGELKSRSITHKYNQSRK